MLLFYHYVYLLKKYICIVATTMLTENCTGWVNQCKLNKGKTVTRQSNN